MDLNIFRNFSSLKLGLSINFKKSKINFTKLLFNIFVFSFDSTSIHSDCIKLVHSSTSLLLLTIIAKLSFIFFLYFLFFI